MHNNGGSSVKLWKLNLEYISYLKQLVYTKITITVSTNSYIVVDYIGFLHLMLQR